MAKKTHKQNPENRWICGTYYLPYKPGASHPVASVPVKALNCFCLFGRWPKIQATRSRTVSQFAKSRHSGRIPHCGVRSGIQNLLMITGHYWILARAPLRGTWQG